MGIPPEYAYLTAVVYFAVIWIFIYIYKPSVRREMLILSLTTCVFGFFQYFYTHDYWRPLTAFGGYFARLDIESFLLSFFYGGVGASLYEAMKWSSPNPIPKPGNRKLTLLAMPIVVVAMLVGVLVLGWNSLYVTVYTAFGLGLTMVLYRPSLLTNALYSAVMFAIVTYGCALLLTALYPGVIEAWWMLENLSGAMLYGIPVEELYFALAWGFFAGPASELVAGMRFKKILRIR